MKKTFVAVAAIAAALAGTVATAGAATAAPVHTAVAQSPLGWDYFGHFDTSDECNSFGQNGQNQGAWPRYECDFDWIDWDYDLYVWVN